MRTRWEYITVIVATSNLRDQTHITAVKLDPFGKHEKIFEQTKGSNRVGEVLAKFGMDGWELFSSTVTLDARAGGPLARPGNNGERLYEYLLKRPVIT